MPPHVGTLAFLIAAFPVAAAAERAVIRDVIDGNTLYACSSGCYKVQIANIDVPEMPPAAKCASEAKAAVDVRTRLIELVQGQVVELIADRRPRDRRARMVARVYLDGRNVGEILIADGLARPSSGRRESWCPADR